MRIFCNNIINRITIIIFRVIIIIDKIKFLNSFFERNLNQNLIYNHINYS